MEPRHKPIRILLIEDESAIADTVVYSLDSEGFESIWHTTGEEGLAAFKELPPALVILDIGLPDAMAWICFTGCARFHWFQLFF